MLICSSPVDIKAVDVKVLHAPLYKGLSIEKLLAEGKKTPRVAEYLPEERDIHRLPRQFVVNLIYTIVGEGIKSFVTKAIKKRNDQIAENRHLIIELDPEIAAAFQQSVNISSK